MTNTSRRALDEQILELVPALLRREVGAGPRHSELLGSVWEAVQAGVEADPATYARCAGDSGRLGEELALLVRAAISSPDMDLQHLGTRSGALATFVDPQLRERADPRATEDHERARTPESAAPEADLETNPLVADALARARADGNDTLQRNLSWMIQRDEGYAYDAIAERAKCPAASVRTGVRRARQAIRRIAQDRRRAAHAPHQGLCPPALEAARDAWREGDLAELEVQLDHAEESLAEHPYYWFLSALLADDRGDRASATALFERVLVRDDEPSLRAKALNCLGYMADDRAELDEAHELWCRSVKVDPNHTPAHINLLKSACDRRDKLDVHVAIDKIGALLTSRTLSRPDKEYLVMRLKEHPDFTWARSFDAWRKGPARWIARQRTTGPAPSTQMRPSRAAAARITLGLALAIAGALAGGLAASTPALETPSEISIERELAGSGDRGGLSGTPRDESPA